MGSESTEQHFRNLQRQFLEDMADHPADAPAKDSRSSLDNDILKEVSIAILKMSEKDYKSALKKIEKLSQEERFTMFYYPEMSIESTIKLMDGDGLPKRSNFPRNVEQFKAETVELCAKLGINIDASEIAKERTVSGSATSLWSGAKSSMKKAWNEAVTVAADSFNKIFKG